MGLRIGNFFLFAPNLTIASLYSLLKIMSYFLSQYLIAIVLKFS